MICPKCHAEYREGVSTCPICGQPLQEPTQGDGVIYVMGKKLACLVCDGTSFTTRTSLLNSRGMTFLGLDWANQGAINYICDSCGYIFWFAHTGNHSLPPPLPEEYISNGKYKIDYESSEALPGECPICFNQVNAGEKECSNCGHKL